MMCASESMTSILADVMPCSHSCRYPLQTRQTEAGGMNVCVSITLKILITATLEDSIKFNYIFVYTYNIPVT